MMLSLYIRLYYLCSFWYPQKQTLSQRFMYKHFMGRSNEWMRDSRSGCGEENASSKACIMSSTTGNEQSFYPVSKFWKMVQTSNFRIISAKGWRRGHTPQLSLKGCLWGDILPCHFFHHIFGKEGSWWCLHLAVMQWRCWKDPRKHERTVDGIYFSILSCRLNSTNILLKSWAKFSTPSTCV